MDWYGLLFRWAYNDIERIKKAGLSVGGSPAFLCFVAFTTKIIITQKIKIVLDKPKFDK